MLSYRASTPERRPAGPPPTGIAPQDLTSWPARTRTKALLTSFLYGGNAAYIEDLYARLRTRSALVDAELARASSRAEGRPRDVAKNAEGAVLEAARTGRRAKRRAGLGARRQLARRREGGRRKDQGQGARAAASNCPRRRRGAGDARFHPRAHDDPRLSHARPSARQSRSARAQAGRSGASSTRLLRLHRSRSRPQDLHRQRARARIRDRARDAGDPAAHLLLDDRRRVHAHLRPEAKGWIQERIEGPGQGDHLHAARASAPSSTSWSRPRASRSSSTSNITGTKRFGLDGAEALIPALEQIIKRGGALGVQGDRARHGPSRPPQRAHPGDGQAAPRAFSTSSRAAPSRRTTWKARATSNTTSAPRRTASSTATRCICR